MITNLEREFMKEMIEACKTGQRDFGYNASRFLSMMSNIGAVETAKQLIWKEGGTEGFETLWFNKRLDLSIEAHVLKEKYMDLFSDEDREICRNRLKEFGYSVNE